MKKLLLTMVAMLALVACTPQGPTSNLTIQCSRNNGVKLEVTGNTLVAYAPPTDIAGDYYVTFNANATLSQGGWQIKPASPTYMPMFEHIYDHPGIFRFVVDFAAHGQAGVDITMCDVTVP